MIPLGVLASAHVAAVEGWAPTDLGIALAAWYDASDAGSIASSGGKVSQWNDLSGNARHVTQATGSAQPGTGLAVVNGRNVLTFEGPHIMRHAPSTAISNAASVTIISAFRRTGADPGYVTTPISLSFGNSARPIDYWQNSSNPSERRFWVGSNSISSSSFFDIKDGADTFGVLTMAGRINGISLGNHEVFQRWNGTLLHSTSNSGTWVASNQIICIGGRDDMGVQFPGDIGELLIVEGAMTSGDISAAEAYLKAKWGTP